MLEDLAAEQPLALVLEDLHWADRSTLDLLALRAHTSRVPGCALVATYRSDELGPGHPLRLLLAELDRTGRTERLELERFGREDLVDQLTGILGAVPEHDLVENVLGRSEGNPVLAEELLAAGSDERRRAPTRVRDIVLARVETRSEQTQEVLRILSAGRRSLAHHTLATVSGLAEPQLEESLREALGTHVLVRAEGGAYAFRHALTREAIYEGLLVSERERLHAELARAIDAERAASGTAGPELLVDLAHHWYSTDDRRRALEAAIEAGLAVDEIYAHAEALTQYEHALELWDLVDEPEHLAGMDRVALRARAAEAAFCLGDPAGAARMIERALDEADRRADPVRAGSLLERLGRFAWTGGDPARGLEAYDRIARNLCEDALETARTVDARIDAGRLEEAVKALRPGIEFTQLHGMHRNHRTWLEVVLALSLIKLGRWAEAGELLEAALLRDPTGVTRRAVQLMRAELALGRGELAVAEDSLADTRRSARQGPPFAGTMIGVAAALAVARRDFDSARSQISQGLAVLEPLDDPEATVRLCWRGLQAEADRAERARAGKRAAETEAAVATAADLLDRARALSGPGAEEVSVEIPALRRTCEAEFARADAREAADLWPAAARAWESLREPHPRAYCLYRAAEAGLAERRPKAEATAALSTAYELALALGAVPLVDAVESVALRGRVDLSAGGARPVEEAPEPTPAKRLGLTPREIEVLRLVAQGYTNGQIASTLFISRKTAGAHVSNILAKLGVARRVEAAAIAERLDLLEGVTPAQ